MNDLQAMDRAHRLGQTRMVDVVRILTRGTIEERLMSIQRFKSFVAGRIVSTDNAQSGQAFDKVLDMLGDSSSFSRFNAPAATATSNTTRMPVLVEEERTLGEAQRALGELADLWESSQYDALLDTARFQREHRG